MSTLAAWSLDLANDPLGLDAIYRLRGEVQEASDRRDQFRNYLDTIPDTGEKAVRRGIGYWVLGRNADAAETLKGTRTNFAEFFRARALLAAGDEKGAFAIFEKLRTDDQVGHASRLAELECLAAANDFEGLAKALKSLPKALGETAESHYFQGRVLEAQGKREEAIVAYERAIEIHPEHRKALFRLAYVMDLHGMDDEALALYEKLVKLPPVDVAVFMNLGVLHEDRGDYARAIGCFDAAIRSDPTNLRAQLYKRDCEASLTMYYDETQERKDDKLQQTLRIPITDFELSVRARNCLTKMNIKTLGDLVRKTENELLSYKNFGETSLNEIKAILTSKNLRLGMLPADKVIAPPPDLGSVDPAIYSKAIGELDLSVRSRRTMDALNIRLVGDLLQHSAEELLAMPNFGQTSLNEIRMKLRALGVDLRDSKGMPNPIDLGADADLAEEDALDDEDFDEDEDLDDEKDEQESLPADQN